MIRAVVFDMDGVISDTQRLHATVEAEVLGEHGVCLSPAEITARYAGVADREFFPAVLGPGRADVAALVEEKWRRMTARAATEVRAVPGAAVLIARLSADGLRLAVASSSPSAFIEHVLDRLRVRHYFAAVASADEVPRSKPEPDVFLLAARRLGVAPEDCAVIEDGRNGMIAARRAGMACVALVDDASVTWPADLVVTDLAALDADVFRRLRSPRPS